MAVGYAAPVIDRIAEHIRTATLTAVTLSKPITRSFVAPGEQWAREGCRSWVIHYAGSRREGIGAGPTPATQGSAFAGPAASAAVHDYGATFVADCYPVSEDPERATNPAEINAWTLDYLADVAAFGQALAELTFPTTLGLVPAARLSLGTTQPFGPSGGLARVTWPLSVNEL